MWEQGSWRWRKKVILGKFSTDNYAWSHIFMREVLSDLIRSLLIVTVDEFYLTMVENAKPRMQEV